VLIRAEDNDVDDDFRRDFIMDGDCAAEGARILLLGPAEEGSQAPGGAAAPGPPRGRSAAVGEDLPRRSSLRLAGAPIDRPIRPLGSRR
jgi:hypothetical protein